jgi:hypothetical protein
MKLARRSPDAVGTLYVPRRTPDCDALCVLWRELGSQAGLVIIA